MAYFYRTETGLIIHGHLLRITEEWHRQPKKNKDFLYYVLMVSHNAVSHQFFTIKHFEYYYAEGFKRAFKCSAN